MPSLTKYIVYSGLAFSLKGERLIMSNLLKSPLGNQACRLAGRGEFTFRSRLNQIINEKADCCKNTIIGF